LIGGCYNHRLTGAAIVYVPRILVTSIARINLSKKKILFDNEGYYNSSSFGLGKAVSEATIVVIEAKFGNYALLYASVLVLRITVLTKYQSTNRANGDTLATILAAGLAHRLISKGGDHSTKAPVSKTDGSPAQLFLAYPDASATENTFVGVVNKQGTTRVYW